MSDKKSASVGVQDSNRPDHASDQHALVNDDITEKLFFLVSYFGHDQELMILECNNP